MTDPVEPKVEQPSKGPLNLAYLLTPAQYFGTYHAHPAINEVIQHAARGLMNTVNSALIIAAEDGVILTVNPATGTIVSGELNGGWRPPECTIGAAFSKHKTGHGVDIYDPKTVFARWCYSHAGALKKLNLSMERHEWTPSWVHLQDIPPGAIGAPWRLDFIPDQSKAKCAPLPEQFE